MTELVEFTDKTLTELFELTGVIITELVELDRDYDWIDRQRFDSIS